MPAAFPEIDKIKYEGPQSKNPLAFRWYNASEKVEGRTMAEQLRFAVVYWHTFRGTGSDPFGSATMQRPWEDGSDACHPGRHIRQLRRFLDGELGDPLVTSG
jgi:xylose isomerase